MNHIKRFALCGVIIFSMAFVASCDKEATKETNAKEEAPAEEALSFSLADTKAAATKMAMAAPKFDFDSIPENIAEIDGEKISKEEYVRVLNSIQKDISASGSHMDDKRLELLRANILKNIINTNTLLRAAKKENISVGVDKVEEKMKSIKSNFPDEEAFKKMMAQRGVTEEVLRLNLHNSLTIQALIEQKITPQISISDEEAKKYYDQNQLQFESQEAVRASHILIKAGKAATLEEKKEAMEKAKALKEKIDKGADFAEIAKAESADPGSARNGGDLGFFTKGKMVPEFEKAAFAAKVGEVTDIVESLFGYHIIKVIDKREAGMQPFDKVKGKIVANLKRGETDKKIKEYLDSLKKEMNVKALM